MALTFLAPCGKRRSPRVAWEGEGSRNVEAVLLTREAAEFGATPHPPTPVPGADPSLSRKGRRAEAGFSVIEALVAIAVASIGLIAVFALQRQLVDGQRRYEHALARAEARRNVLALLRDLNPVELPSGRMELPPNARLVWTSRPLTEFRRTTGLPVGDGVFEVRLYTIVAKLTDAQDHARESLSFDRLGWRRIGGPATAATLGF